MFLGRFNLFKCDKCGVEKYLSGFGLPTGWIYIPQRGGVIHYCKECEQKRKESNGK